MPTPLPSKVGALTEYHHIGTERVFTTLAELYYTLYSFEREFFDCLDLELAKVDQFFVAREREIQIKATALRGQFQKLEHHRKLFHVRDFLYDIWPANERTSPGICRPAKSIYKPRDYRWGSKFFKDFEL